MNVQMGIGNMNMHGSSGQSIQAAGGYGFQGGSSSTSTSHFHAMASIPKTLSHFSSAGASATGAAGAGTGASDAPSHEASTFASSMNDNVLGQRFLSSAGVDTQSLFRKARGLQSKSQSQTQAQSQSHSQTRPTQTASASSPLSTSVPFKLHPNLYTSIEEMRSATISNILLRQRQNTDRIVQEKIQARLTSRAKRIQSKSSLGHIIPGSTGRRVLGSIGSGTGTGTGGGADVSDDSASYPVVDLDLNHELIQNHLIMTQANTGESFTLSGLEKIAREYGMQATEYQHAIALFQALVGGSGIGSGSGSSSSSFSPHGRVVSTVQYLTTLFRNYIIAQVKNHPNPSSTSSNDTGAGGLLGYIYKYVEMELGRSVTNVGTSDVLWRVIYYALRCGDFLCVRDVLRNSPAGQVDPIVVQYVEEACRLGVDVRAMDKISDGMVNSMLELYRRVESRGNPQRAQGGGPSTTSPSSMQYQLVALGLMSFSSTIDNNSLVTTIEDYLLMGLWTALRQRDNEIDCVDTVCALADNVKHWGPDYFEDDSSASSGWAYAMPLLLCQQYKSGIEYLASSSRGGGLGLCLAVHMGLAIHREGIRMTDLSKINNDGTGTGEEKLLETLVVVFAKSLQNVSPTSALDYLVHIPGSETADLGMGMRVTSQSGVEMKNGKRLSMSAQSHICNLILDTKAYDILCGAMAGDGSRLANGALDKYFAKGAVSDILATVADRSMREGRMADAAQLLCLAMRYSDLLSVLNRQLASLLVINGISTKYQASTRNMQKEEERAFWRGNAENFAETYLKAGQTHVIKVLEAERNLSLGNTFQLLLNLMEFFDRCKSRNWVGAWELIENLNILPKDSNDIPSKIEVFESLSPCVQHSFHHVILSSMEVLSEQHAELKRSLSEIHMQGPGMGVMGAGATEQRMYELRNKARVLVTFAGLISKVCDMEVKSRIQRLEARMI